MGWPPSKKKYFFTAHFAAPWTLPAGGGVTTLPPFPLPPNNAPGWNRLLLFSDDLSTAQVTNSTYVNHVSPIHMEDRRLAGQQYGKELHDSHCKYNVTFRCVRTTILQWKSNEYYILWVCVFVALGIHQVKRMHSIVICGLPRSKIFFIIS